MNRSNTASVLADSTVTAGSVSAASSVAQLIHTKKQVARFFACLPIGYPLFGRDRQVLFSECWGDVSLGCLFPLLSVFHHG